ncbi:MAG: VOC family protein [Dehalococcoidia bacterium]|nr:VOC family protein [Dehalococcoidia bacterium]
MAQDGGGVHLGQIGQITMPVRDLPRAVAFYGDTLGLRLLFQAPPGLTFFDCGGVRLMLAVPESAEFDHPGTVIYFKARDIHAAHATLLGRGVHFRDAPHVIHKTAAHTLLMAFFLDNEGNTLALMEEVPV